MFKRPHHQNIVRFLEKLDADLLERTGCYFGGGTAIVLSANEYRESIDIDFLCASAEGYRQIRELVSDNDINKLAREPIKLVRDVRKDRDKIYTVIDAGSGERPIKFELVREARIPIEGQRTAHLPVATLCQTDLYAEKILANADRWPDPSVMYRDAIDLAMMVDQWGPIPGVALAKAEAAYGKDAIGSLVKVTAYLSSNTAVLDKAVAQMGMDPTLSPRIAALLQAEVLRLAPQARSLEADDELPKSLAATLASKGLVVQRVDETQGRYIGKILLVADGYAVQNLGRNTAAAHKLSAGLAVPSVGDIYSVQYNHGHADWEPRLRTAPAQNIVR
ncbi:MULTISPECIES: nucleotidyl transferase AbiEii/AbiGii toxin family protein [Burkholderia]|jgi:hypothetical protein|uniref:nucleotidyl transferase AbiEii/AbiGii toxin family protein n=1 Tax=Burkholderia TaxID=32008 RepID=UPI0021C13ACF|nr:nucleotidyl transferase AbiEii/AbiGii toxin family protein [Burkholderia multivorans]MDR9051056.1 hypothetical protein [Burkholderia multivorans]MDR9062694.1 hypothetical protein [Burkholderia multivorans]MDR9078035.1 hypothetical protein [Burkholderia multivorans]MDR9093562.1 hypothetical protein [Burkholderia multivorans]MDR9099407.1 hypothetical protein [Burkholderia multivorans]